MEVAENYLGQITHVIDPDNFSMQVGTGMTIGVGGMVPLRCTIVSWYRSVYNVQPYGDGTFVVFQFVVHIYYYGITNISHDL